MNFFYEPGLDESTTILNTDESYHCVKVLRMKEGDGLFITNGKGLLCEAVLGKADKKGCIVDIIDVKRDYEKRHCRLHLAIAPTKSIDRFEWLLEKAVECGVDVITPVLCEHSERRILKPERMEKLLVAAMKQSQRTYLPKMNTLTKFSDFINGNQEEDRFIAHCTKGEDNPLIKAYSAGHDVVILIGPEGDFSKDEITMAEAKGFEAISMGKYRLRTETAGIVACVQINGINGLL